MLRKKEDCPLCKGYIAAMTRYAKRHELLLAALRIGAVERALMIAESAADAFLTDVDYKNPCGK